MEEIFLVVFQLALFSIGLWCVVSPESVVRFRTKMGWPVGYWSGGFAYATPQRTRFTGSLLLLMAVVVISVRLFGR
jgi:hypothetical protein